MSNCSYGGMAHAPVKKSTGLIPAKPCPTQGSATRQENRTARGNLKEYRQVIRDLSYRSVIPRSGWKQRLERHYPALNFGMIFLHRCNDTRKTRPLPPRINPGLFPVICPSRSFHFRTFLLKTMLKSSSVCISAKFRGVGLAGLMVHPFSFINDHLPVAQKISSRFFRLCRPDFQEGPLSPVSSMEACQTSVTTSGP